jgi:desulfoferrodoxin-like iron-binding protein
MEGSVVNVQNAGEIYRCNICGNVVLVSEAGGGELICHGEPMQLIGQEEKTG